jgi:hypothetical protein
MFGITSPWYQDPVEHTAFNAYAYHQNWVDQYIELLAAADDPNDSAEQLALLHQVGRNPSDLSQCDIDYIEREVAKRWQS